MFVCPECANTLPEAGRCPADGAKLVDASTDPMLGQQVDSYRIAAKIGAGGMGAVYKAVQPAIGSRVAIKVLSEECAASSQAVQRFFAEAQAVNLIRHDNIVNVLDLASLPNGQPYILMEYLEGRSLRELIATEGPLPVAQALELVGQVLDALSAAHGRHIVHRDIKPENVFVTKAGRIKVLDFGVAKLRPAGGDGLTRPGQLLGTPHYMAPEQVATLPVDARTDIYAVGLLLFEALTGQPTFHGTTPMELLQHHVRTAAPRPSSLRPELSPALDEVVLHALRKDPRDRYPSAQAFRQALEQASAELSSTPGHAAGPTPARRPADAFAPTALPSIDPSAPTVAASVSVCTPATPPAAPAVAAELASGVQTHPVPRPPARRSLWLGVGFAVAALAAVAAGAIYLAVSSLESPRIRSRAAATQRPSDPSKVDFAWAVRRATKAARRAHADAQLLSISVNGISYDGTVDLARGANNTISLVFSSEADRACVHVMYTSAVLAGSVASGAWSRCPAIRPVRLPQCSIKQVLRRAYPGAKNTFPRRVTVLYSRPERQPLWVVLGHSASGETDTQHLPDDC